MLTIYEKSQGLPGPYPSLRGVVTLNNSTIKNYTFKRMQQKKAMYDYVHGLLVC